MTNIVFDSELMENQKHADLMTPGLDFDVLQASDGSALFFSIGTDNVFYVTHEIGGSPSGWNRLDLSSQLAQQHAGASVAAHRFAVSQNAQSGAIDLALAIAVGGTDFLYLSRGNSTVDSAWASGVAWTAVPFDDPKQPMPVLEIADLYVLQTTQAEYFVVDIAKQPGSSLNLVFRYYITPHAPASSAQQWNEHDLSGNLTAGTIQSCLGLRAGDQVAGVYTLGNLLGTEELLFTPLYNPFDSNRPGSPARLAVPDAACAIATALDATGASHLFVAGDKALVHFAPSKQQDGATGTQVVTNSLISGVQSLHAATTAGATIVWGVNQQNQLFYVRCKADSEDDPSAWSYPLPILTGVQQIAPLLNPGHDNSVIFAHTDGHSVIQLTQDPVTSHWQQRYIVLPGPDPDDLVTYKSLTTHVKMSDVSNTPCGNLAVAVTSTSPVSVYLNDVYYRLSHDQPVQVQTDTTGVLTIVQETQAVAGVSYGLQLTTTGEAVAINPLTNAMTRLSAIQDGPSLDAVTVPNGDGTRSKLLPASVTDDQKAAVASSIQRLATIGAQLASPAPGGSLPTAPSDTVWSVVFGTGTATFTAGKGTLDVASAIEVAAGDLFNWVKTAYDDASQLVVQEAEGVYHFFLQLGDDVFHFVLDCLSAVTHAVELVFNKIGVFFEDLIKWLGFLFEWGDIVRTHDVLVNLFQCYVTSIVGGLESVKSMLQSELSQVEGTIDQWAGIAAPSTTVATYQGSANLPAQDSPQANWANHHLKSNAALVATTYTPPQTDSNALSTILSDLEGLLTNEETAFKTAYQQIKEQIVDQLASLSSTDVIKRLAAILSDLLLTSAENIIVTGLDVVEALIAGVMDMLTAPISIPVISKVYRDQTGKQLSFLDAVCLVAAIPATVIYKAARDAAPFADCATTTSLIQAKDFVGIQQICAGGTSAPRAAAALPGDVSSQTLLALKVVLNVAAMAAAMPLKTIGDYKRKVGSENVPVALNVLTDALTLPYVSPALPLAIGPEYSTWYVAVRDALTLAGIGKAVIDNIPAVATNTVWATELSPGLDSALNVSKLAASLATVCEKPPTTSGDWVGFTAVACSNLGGALSAATVDKFWPELGPDAEPTAQGFFNARQYSIVAYAVLCSATAIAVLADID